MIMAPSDKSLIRFLQRLDSFSRAFNRLEEFVNVISDSKNDTLFSKEESGFEAEIMSEALIKRFEFNQELSWNLLKDYLQYEGERDVAGSRDTYRRALRLGLINSPLWMDMITDRNLSAHDYNDIKAKEICGRIVNTYYPLFKQLLESMRSRALDITKADSAEESSLNNAEDTDTPISVSAEESSLNNAEDTDTQLSETK